MISEFFQGLRDFHFLQNALITAIVIGIVAGAVGCFIILRGMSLMGDAISYAVLPGVALSYILGINFFIGAITFELLASIIITYIKGNSIIKSDTVIGITFSSFLALGVILIGVANSSTHELQPRNQHTRNNPRGQVLGRRQMAHHSTAFGASRARLPRHRRQRLVSALPRRARESGEKLPVAASCPLLDDIRARVSHSSTRDTEYRYGTYRRDRL